LRCCASKIPCHVAYTRAARAAVVTGKTLGETGLADNIVWIGVKIILTWARAVRQLSY
jgi:hypothetical protein